MKILSSKFLSILVIGSTIVTFGMIQAFADNTSSSTPTDGQHHCKHHHHHHHQSEPSA